MAKLSEEEQAQLDALTKKSEEPEPAESRNGLSTNVNLTIDLNDEVQVRRAIKAGYLPASYLEDDKDKDDDDDDDDKGKDDDKDDAPRRKLGERYR